jgi:seryl-tRNA synthetase
MSSSADIATTGWFDAHGDGRLTLGGAAPAVCRAIDRHIRRAMESFGARELQFPTLMNRSVLERGGYFQAFEGAETAIQDAEYVLQPAVCYHCYAHLAGQHVNEVTITCAGRCYRRREASFSGATRLWEFTMREVVFIGDSRWVREQWHAWGERAMALARALGLEAVREPATDPFFGSLARGQRLLQQLKESKYEIRADAAPGQRVALASTNLHESFFADRFDLRTHDGGRAHSACVAFGLERWAAALVWQRGEEAASALASTQS